MSSEDGVCHHPQHPMTDRRKVPIPWDLDLHNGNEVAALEAKKKFCAEIDAAGRSTSPFSTISRDDPGSEEGYNLYKYFPELLNFDIEPQPKRRKLWNGIWDSSKATVDEKVEKGTVDTAIVTGNGTSKSPVVEESVDEDEDLYGLTPKAIVEDSMDENADLEGAPRQFAIVEKTLTVNEFPTALKDSTAQEQINFDDGNRLSTTREVVDVPDDCESSSGTEPSSGSDTEYTEGATEPIRDALRERFAQNENKRSRRASRASSRASRKSKTDTELPDIDRIAETPRNASKNYPRISPKVLQNASHSGHLDLDMVTEAQTATDNVQIHNTSIDQPDPASHAAPVKPLVNSKDQTAVSPVPLIYPGLLPEAPISLSTPIPALPWSISPQAQASGAQHQTSLERSRDPDATVVPNTNHSASYRASANTLTRPAVETPYQRVPEPTYDGPTHFFIRRPTSRPRVEGPGAEGQNRYVIDTRLLENIIVAFQERLFTLVKSIRDSWRFFWKSCQDVTTIDLEDEMTY
jgi:hypothetical protein